MAGLSDPKGQLLTTLEAAKLLRMSSRTLENMRVDGTGPKFIKLGPGRQSKVVYRIGDLDAWLAKYERGSTSEDDHKNEDEK